MNAARLLGSALLLSCLCASFRGQWWQRPPPPLASWRAVGAGPPTLVPNLATSDPLMLSWLPGVGRFRAEAIVAGRAQLDVPLTPARLALLPEIGAETAAEVAAWYDARRE